ncbi:hypothetical protein EDD68_10784 [Melghiribacillus thermohalophilus]|uniref:Uncharacterized protein n=1 Tax=Melghiribacillus thermohalophilus TaxID=1324956 RepID=A0A4R3N2P1_9BACI|nr:hypothetical protein [Melghiribacillus thermohalophilus]TCT23370.1 hypothetical protein EDD68_10784 [Melghiribacillus thermohalophilus]
MEQTTIYEFYGLESDPVYQKINNLQPGEELYIEEVIVRKNTNSLFEIETEDLHEPATGEEACYWKLMSILNAMETEL